MVSKLVTALIVVIVVPGVLVGYIWLTEQVLRLVSERMKPRIRPWLWLAPALGLLGLFLVYPMIGTVITSLQDKFGKKFVGLTNYSWFFGSDDALTALKNNLLWLVFLTLLTVGIGLLVAVLVDRVRYESIAKSVIFVPLAISMVAAGIIWLYMYNYNPPGSPQTGTLNAAIGAVGVIHNGKVAGTPPFWSPFISGSVITYTTKRAALLDPRTKSCSNGGCAHAVKAVTRSTPQPFRAWSSTTCTRRMAEPPPPSTRTCGTAPTNCLPS